jgi:hypothetical protein
VFDCSSYDKKVPFYLRSGERYTNNLFTQHPTPLAALPEDIREALPPETKEKANIYHRDMPVELVSVLDINLNR